MTRVRLMWPAARRIFDAVLHIALSLFVLDWALYVQGWIASGLFVNGIRGCFCLIAGGVLVSTVLLATAPLFYRDEVR